MSSFLVDPRRLIGDFAIPPPASSSSISWLLPNGTHFYKIRSLWHWRQCFPDTTITSYVRKLSEPQTSRFSLHCPNTTRKCNHVHSSCVYGVEHQPALLSNATDNSCKQVSPCTIRWQVTLQQFWISPFKTVPEDGSLLIAPWPTLLIIHTGHRV